MTDPAIEESAPGPRGRVVQRGLRLLSRHQSILGVLVVRALAIGSGFAVTFLIGRLLGAEATGQYALVMQTALLLSAVALFGLNTSFVRHLAKAVAEKVPLALSTVSKAMAIGLALQAGVAGVIFLTGDLSWGFFFGDSVPKDFLAVLCILVMVRGAIALLAGLLRSQHSFITSQVLNAVAIPLSTGAALAIGLVDTVGQALWAGTLGGIAFLLVGTTIMARHIGTGTEALQVRLKVVLGSSLPLWGVDLAQKFGEWIALASAAQMLSAADAGIYRVGFQLALVLQVASMALFSVYSAQISSAFHAQDRNAVAHIARTAVRLSSAITAVLSLALVATGPFILEQIGPEFAGAYPVLILLIAGQLAITLTGPCGLVLAMSGNERINLLVTVIGTVALGVSVPLAAHFYGLYGIAVCASLVQLIKNVTTYVIVRRKLGIGIWSGTVHSHDRQVRA